MREGSARLLAAAKHRAQSLEAAKALLISNERMSVYMAELQSRRRESLKKPWLVLTCIFFVEMSKRIRRERMTYNPRSITISNNNNIMYLFSVILELRASYRFRILEYL